MRDPDSIKNQHENLLAEYKRIKTRIKRYSEKDINDDKYRDLINNHEITKNKLNKFYYKYGAFMKIRKNGMGKFDIEKYKKSIEEKKDASQKKQPGNEFLKTYLQATNQHTNIMNETQVNNVGMDSHGQISHGYAQNRQAMKDATKNNVLQNDETQFSQSFGIKFLENAEAQNYASKTLLQPENSSTYLGNNLQRQKIRYSNQQNMMQSKIITNEGYNNHVNNLQRHPPFQKFKNTNAYLYRPNMPINDKNVQQNRIINNAQQHIQLAHEGSERNFIDHISENIQYNNQNEYGYNNYDGINNKFTNQQKTQKDDFAKYQVNDSDMQQKIRTDENNNIKYQHKVLNSTENFYKIHNYINKNISQTATSNDRYTEKKLNNKKILQSDNCIVDNQINNDYKYCNNQDNRQYVNYPQDNSHELRDLQQTKRQRKQYTKKITKTGKNVNQPENNLDQNTIFNDTFLQTFDDYKPNETMESFVTTKDSQEYKENVELENSYMIDNKNLNNITTKAKRTYKKKDKAHKTENSVKMNKIKIETLQNNEKVNEYTQNRYYQNIATHRNIKNENYDEENEESKYINEENVNENILNSKHTFKHNMINPTSINQARQFAMTNKINDVVNVNIFDKEINSNLPQSYDIKENANPKKYTMKPNDKKNEMYNNMNTDAYYNNQNKKTPTNMPYIQNMNQNYAQNNPQYIDQHSNSIKHYNTQISEEEQNYQYANLQYQRPYMNDGSNYMYSNIQQANYNNMMLQPEIAHQNMTYQTNHIPEPNNHLYNRHPQDQYFGVDYQQNVPPPVYNMYTQPNYYQNNAQSINFNEYNMQNNYMNEHMIQNNMYMNPNLPMNLAKQHYFINEEYNLRKSAEKQQKKNERQRSDTKNEEKTVKIDTKVKTEKKKENEKSKSTKTVSNSGNVKLNRNNAMQSKTNSMENQKSIAKVKENDEDVSFFEKTTILIRSDVNDDTQKDTTKKFEDTISEYKLTGEATNLIREMCDIFIENICNTACLITKGKEKNYLTEEDVKQAFTVEKYYDFPDQAFAYKPELDIEHEKRVLAIQKDNKSKK